MEYVCTVSLEFSVQNSYLGLSKQQPVYSDEALSFSSKDTVDFYNSRKQL